MIKSFMKTRRCKTRPEALCCLSTGVADVTSLSRRSGVFFYNYLYFCICFI